MENKRLWLVMVFTLGVMVVGCPPEPDDGGKNPSFPAAKGIMTIENLGDFNGKYVYVQGLVGSNSLLVGLTDIDGYPNDISYKLAKIAGGEAEVPLYTANSSATKYENSYIAYSGNDDITSINIIILSDSSLKSSNAATAINGNADMKTFKSGAFENGYITLDWKNVNNFKYPDSYKNTIPDNPIQLAENQWAEAKINKTNYYSSNLSFLLFTATASTQYIHFKYSQSQTFGLEIFDSNGKEIGDYTSHSKENLSRTVTLIPGQTYLIVIGYATDYLCQITFSSSATPPN